jgi:hypothetical protein
MWPRLFLSDLQKSLMSKTQAGDMKWDITAHKDRFVASLDGMVTYDIGPDDLKIIFMDFVNGEFWGVKGHDFHYHGFAELHALVESMVGGGAVDV